MGSLPSWHSLEPGVQYAVDTQPIAWEKCCALDFAPPGSQAHPGSRMYEEGHAEAQGGRARPGGKVLLCP